MDGIKSNVLIDNRKGYLALPFDEEQFKDFIQGLLGTPQTITKRIRGNFELSLTDLQNFHQLITQRIIQQNNGQLIQLKTKIYYSDESNVTLSSYEELITYNEIKPIISVAVRMTWTYLIKFTDKKIPEKQEIGIMIISTSDNSLIEDDGIPVIYPSIGQFEISIEHTARSWGSDIEALITTQIHSIIHKPSKVKTFLRKHDVVLGLITALLSFIISLYTIYLYTSNFTLLVAHEIEKLIKGTASLDTKINFLLNYIMQNKENILSLHCQLYILISMIVSVILGFWVASLADINEKSFIVLTKKAKEHVEKVKEKDKHKVMCFFGSVLVSILCSVLASLLYTWLSNS